ncbi:glycosyltransferase family 4 protein [Niallia taxi]|uniref:glycosyltransferase family 4 protein n=1 Tax=Niallia taxi TaxID=2499688 RepID=UPI003982AE28
MTNRLFVSVDFPPENGGIQNYVYGIVSHLNPQNTVVLTSNRAGEDNYRSFDEKQQFKTYRIGITNQVSFVRQMVQLVVLFFSVISIHKKHKVEELHFGNIMPIGIAAPLLKKVLKVDFYPYIHGLDFLESKTNHLKFRLLMYSLKHATKIICNSNYTKGVLLKSGIEKERLTVIHPGIPPQNAPSYDRGKLIEKYQLQDKIVLVTVGRLVKRKGHDKVIESIKELVKEYPKIKYVICGKGPERENLEGIVQKYKLQQHVVFTGDIDRNELEGLYSIARLFIMLNRELKEQGDVEGYGIVFLEAGIHKLPVIGGNNGGVPDAIIDGHTGFLVNSSNQKEINNVIETLLRDDSLSTQIGENGYKWVSENCLWEHRVSLLKNLGS